MDYTSQNPIQGNTVRGNQTSVVNIADLQDPGGYGFAYISDTEVHEPTAGYVFNRLILITETTFTTLTPTAGAPISGTVTGVAIPAGVVLTGRFTAIDLTSGSLIAYQIPIT